MRDAVDFMNPPDTALLEKMLLDALPYTGNARPSAAWFADMKARGLTVRTMIQETVSTRSQQGEQAGIYDCQFAERRAREVNPDVVSIAVVVSDGSWSDIWDCSAYGRGWASVATLRFFPYGATECCSSFIRGAKGINNLVIDGEWIPETWGAGRLITQVVGPSPVPDSDLNHVHADYTGGSSTGEFFTMGQMEDLAQWDNDTRVYIDGQLAKRLETLKQDIAKGLDNITADIKAHVDAEIAKIPAGTGGTVQGPLKVTLSGTAAP